METTPAQSNLVDNRPVIKLHHYVHCMEKSDMTDVTPTNKRFYIKLIFPFLIRPRQTYEHVLLRKATWYTPLLVISLLMLTQIFVNETKNSTSSGMVPSESIPMEGVPPQGKGIEGGSSGEVEGGTSPDGMVSGTGSSPGLMGALLPAAGHLAGIWVGWFVLTLVLFVALVISGSKGNFTQALNLTAWSSLPYAIQILAQVLFAFIYSSATSLPQGLAGLAIKVQGLGGQYLGIFLQRVDVFLIWQIALLMIGAVYISQLPAGKARWLVVLAVLFYLVLAALPAFGIGQFSLLQSAAQPKY
jgi:hypothetical protein